MAPAPTKLQKVGEEAFMLLDQIEQKPRARVHRFTYRPEPTQMRIYAPPAAIETMVIDSFMAAQKYRGINFIEHYTESKTTK